MGSCRGCGRAGKDCARGRVARGVGNEGLERGEAMRGMQFRVGSMLLGAASLAGAAGMVPGARLESFSLRDQRGVERQVDQSTRMVLFSRDKDLAKMAFALLDSKPSSFLDERRACIVLDISAMPKVITWAIARPRMRRHGFPILLDAGPGPTRDIPTRDKRLTILFVNQLKVERIVYVSSRSELEAALGLVGTLAP